MLKSLQASLIALALLSGCVVTALFCRSAWSQTLAVPMASQSQTGRYQIAASQNVVTVLDTQTGRVWGKNYADSTWTLLPPLPSPNVR